jgi:cyclic beta-1,2-glucan synthetase
MTLRMAFNQSSAARAAPWDNEESIREELFSTERLEQHARSLAEAQPITAGRTRGRSLAARLMENEAVLLASNRAIAEAVRNGRPLTASAEWLFDNFPLVEQQIREIRSDLPSGYYLQLPKLADGPFAGFPRVFGVAWAFVAHTDSRFDPEMLRRFVRAYQQVQPLAIGELWAIAITLRIVLVENLRRASRRIVASRLARREADRLADRLLGAAASKEQVARMLRRVDRAPLTVSFAVQLVQRLRDQDPKVTPALDWLEGRLAEQGRTVDQIVREEHQRQGATNVTVRTVITSMRMISEVDWAALVESISLIDDTLRRGSRFAEMDFPTRNAYRNAIEELARGSNLTEQEIADAALACACESQAGGDGRGRDPGYHLIAGGRRAFEAKIGFRAPLHAWRDRLGAVMGLGGYIGAALVIAAIFLAVPLVALAEAGIGRCLLALFAALGAIPATDAALALVNSAVTRGYGTSVLPGLALRDGIPPEMRTLVVVPTLLTTRAALDEQIDNLEILHLGNPDGELYFALLSDWKDAPAESVEGDQALLDAAAAGIADLNRRHAPAVAGDRFFLLHRRRVWSEDQQCWIGWERKRGKLHELNRLLRGATDTNFIAAGGAASRPPGGIRFVITLDADTRLPRDAARRLVGKLAHPLNRARFDAALQRVVEGYGILQPRVSPSLPTGSEGSPYQRVMSGLGGIDPYAAAASDVYQDLFEEGSFTGKGIYDVDVFEAALEGRVRDGTLLSHDLFEGTFARAGLVSDIEVVEEFPLRYDTASARQHRWVRGDWQLLPFIVGRELPAIGRWKMLDNLRRSLSAPASVAALVAGWMLPVQLALVWTGFILSTIALPALLPVLAAVIPRQARVTTRSHFRALAEDFRLADARFALSCIFLAHQAWLMVDAIGRTLYRLAVSRRHLLDWVTAAQLTTQDAPGVSASYRQMKSAVVIGIAATVAVSWAGGAAWPVALPLVLAWIASPGIARWVSRAPPVAERLPIAPEDARALRRVARNTWRFFETFVTPADHMLPPDNFQEDPKAIVATRTSPTNLGVYLLSAVSARDFGWAGTTETVERIEATLATMGELKRHRGHFYNWYDTRDLRPLEPMYVSSVDSGNLAGHLVALANACGEWIDGTLPVASVLAGVRDSLDLCREAAQALPDDRRTQTITRNQLTDAFEALESELRTDDGVPGSAAASLARVRPHAATIVDVAHALASERGDEAGAGMQYWAEATLRAVDSHLRDVTADEAALQSLQRRIAALAGRAREMADAMEFGFLVNRELKLLSIGYRVAEDQLDPGCYDLLASEARLASFVAIAKGDLPSTHWFRLGRAVTPLSRGAALISWSGSMFEYLMPSLVMRAPFGSLLEQTNRLVVRRQIAYGTELGVPWGISESAYNVRDLEFTYQYSNFGVPGLGLKRGLGGNAVIAPYATALAAMVDPGAAAANFARLVAAGGRGRFGFYEALDFTRSRLPEGKEVVVVRAYMAHHQGMTVVAIANALLDGVMRTRFHAEPVIRATELLLQERMPRNVAVARPRVDELRTTAAVDGVGVPTVRRLRSPHGAAPETHLLSNHRYAVMLSAAGSGYSRCGELGITRWREDVTRDDWGAYVFLRDAESGAVWSAAFQPSGVEPDSYRATFTEDRAEFVRLDGATTTMLEVIVSPEYHAEVRRVTVANAGNRPREIEFTSYAEVVLAPPAADSAHPAFSKLFVQTEYDAKTGAILATRRRRSSDEPEIWAAQIAVTEGEETGDAQFETDRARFLGRGGTVRKPIAIMDGRPLSNTVGTVLDPVFALRRRMRVPPGRTVHVAFWTVVASSRSDVLDLVDKHRDATAFDRAATLAWTQAQVQLGYLGISADEASLFQRLAGRLIYGDSSLRPSSETIRRGSGGPAPLWAHGISGDLPIVLVRIDDIEQIAIVRQLLAAHEYWRMKQLAVDLVVLNERGASYIQDLQNALEAQVRSSQSRPRIGADTALGSVFVLRADLLSTEARARLLSVARAVLVAGRGTLAEQLDHVREAVLGAVPPPPAPLRSPSLDASQPARLPPGLEFFNGLGGFTPDGREYVTTFGVGRSTPAPWINVIANSRFGFQVAVEGSGFTWSGSSRENQITPWSNDPVTDRPGEAVYVRDEDSGELWGPTALPVRHETAPYVATHGQGYSRFEHSANGVDLGLLQFVPIDDPVKISRLTIRNTSDRTRRLSVTAYVEWVLGPSRSASSPSIETAIDPETGAMLARNPWNIAYGSRVAFADLGGRQSAWTGDRREFLGRNGTLANPLALAGPAVLSGRVGAGFDPCGALQAAIEIEPGATREILFLLGQAGTEREAQALISRYRTADLDAALASVVAHWDDVLGAVQVKTPDRAMDIMLNRWLLYQTLSCRMWARSAFYQASGAYGFRDQLQDGMALTLTRPAIAREHLLRAAARQFIEGDVQHWWLPASGDGVRTRISDDRAWLAHAAAHYVQTTGDSSVLDVPVPFLSGRPLAEGEHDAFFRPESANETATFFEHCARGLDLSLATGSHGLPLIGTGDWNDGMNRVGEQGRGESVWLGWFLCATLAAFVPIARARGEDVRAATWQAHAAALKSSIEQNGWDGDWYRRGYFDDGTPLGSAASEECRIDSIAQSWGVISGAADPARARHAMAAMEAHLVRPDERLALLLAPPFDRTPLDPGYIRGYPPGIRENGGQYTHAATWSIFAFGALGQGEKAAALFAMANPITRSSTRADVQRYKVEPYAVAADVYSVGPHAGRGGWTWYTGAAGWLYRAGIEAILGLRTQGSSLLISPCIPRDWPRYEVAYRFGSTRYEIAVENEGSERHRVARAELDGVGLPGFPVRIPLVDDGRTHAVRVILS